MSFQLPALIYGYDALEPFIDKLTMETHHTKHHQTYVNKLNEALEPYDDLHGRSLEDLLTGLNQLPDKLRAVVQNNGGGHYNHSLFWEIMSPSPQQSPDGELASAIEKDLGGFQSFQHQFKQAALTRFGSGWAWLVDNNGTLEVISTANQDSPISKGKQELMGIDVWEHAYYLRYMNRRPDYVDAWWNVLDWKKVEERFQKIRG